MAGERPRGDRPRRSAVERELDRQELGWGEFWLTQLFTAPIMVVGMGALFWFLDREQGVVQAAARAALFTTGLFGVALLGHVWRRRTARRVIAAGEGLPTSSDAASATEPTWASRHLFGGPPLRGLERRLVMVDLLRLGLVGALLTALAVPLALSDVLPGGAVRVVVRGVAVCAAPLAVVGLLSAALVFLRGRR